MNLTPQYIAGFLDGEGCIQMIRQRKKDRYSWSYRIQVAVNNTYQPIVRALHERYGGIYFARKKLGNNKPVYVWHLSGYRIKVVLDEVLPYLIEKKNQAELGLKYLEEYKPSKRGYRVSEEDLAFREGFYWALREAKRH